MSRSKKRAAPTELTEADYKDVTTQDWMEEPVHMPCRCDRSERGRYHERATLETAPAQWEGVLRAQLQGEEAAATPAMLLGALQDKMGEVVLGMPSGSRVQGVLAEMLNELISRSRTIEAEAASS